MKSLKCISFSDTYVVLHKGTMLPSGACDMPCEVDCMNVALAALINVDAGERAIRQVEEEGRGVG